MEVQGKRKMIEHIMVGVYDDGSHRGISDE